MIYFAMIRASGLPKCHSWPNLWTASVKKFTCWPRQSFVHVHKLKQKLTANRGEHITWLNKNLKARFEKYGWVKCYTGSEEQRHSSNLVQANQELKWWIFNTCHPIYCQISSKKPWRKGRGQAIMAEFGTSLAYCHIVYTYFYPFK